MIVVIELKYIFVRSISLLLILDMRKWIYWFIFLLWRFQ